MLIFMKVEFLKMVFISKELSKDLALRYNAIQFFDKINKEDSKEIVIDFSNVDTITLSFADEYLKRKKQSKKEIKEEHVPINISKMFEIIGRINHPPPAKLVN